LKSIADSLIFALRIWFSIELPTTLIVISQNDLYIDFVCIPLLFYDLPACILDFLTQIKHQLVPSLAASAASPYFPPYQPPPAAKELS
jgi:hypothetical protein